MLNKKADHIVTSFFTKKGGKSFNFEDFRFDVSNVFFENIAKISTNEYFKSVTPKEIFFGGSFQSLSVNLTFVDIETGELRFIFNKNNGDIKVFNEDDTLFEIKNSVFKNGKSENLFYGESFSDLILSLKILQYLKMEHDSLSGYFFDLRIDLIIHFFENELIKYLKR